MLPVLAAVGMVFSAINAASAVKSMFSDSGKTAAAPAVENSTKTVQGSAAPTSSAVAMATGAGSGEIQDRFLKLLVTQLKNQDPLNPMDNAQLTSQLAQINTVSGIQQLNTTMQSLSTSLLSAQSSQSAGLIGRRVVAEGSQFALTGSATPTGGVQLAQSADSVKINIIGSAGTVVRQIDLGSLPAGFAGFQWDGLSDSGAKAAAGTYSIQVAATSRGQKVGATPLVAGAVTSVSLAGGAVRLTVDGVGEIEMQQIKNIM